MKFLDTKHKRKSVVITVSILVLLLFIMFNYGMKYMDPPIEYGVVINFGNTDFGKGKASKEVLTPTKTEEVKQEPQKAEETPKPEQVEEKVEMPQPQPKEQEVKEKTEKMLVDETPQPKDVPVVKKTLEPNIKETVKKVEKTQDNPVEKPIKTTPKKAETPKEVKPIEKPKPKPTVSDATKKALQGLLGNDNQGSSQGDDEKEGGVKGNPNAEGKSSKYYGNTGLGGNYRLAGRTALSKPKKNPDCEEEGTVVVEIYVNNRGKVVKADPCKKGTTNSASCLCKAAKEAALSTVWNTDADAPANQKGKIIYRFSLTK